jgi:hypothetical protein
MLDPMLDLLMLVIQLGVQQLARVAEILELLSLLITFLHSQLHLMIQVKILDKQLPEQQQHLTQTQVQLYNYLFVKPMYLQDQPVLAASDVIQRQLHPIQLVVMQYHRFTQMLIIVHMYM